MAKQRKIRLGILRLQVQSLALLSGLRIQHCHELWCRSQTWLKSGIAVLWCRPAAVAPIRPLAWEPPYAVGVTLKRKKNLEFCASKFNIKKVKRWSSHCGQVVTNPAGIHEDASSIPVLA